MEMESIMKRSLVFFWILALISLAGCGVLDLQVEKPGSTDPTAVQASPQPAPTGTALIVPTLPAAATPTAPAGKVLLSLAVLSGDAQLSRLDTTFEIDPGNPPAFNGLLPAGGVALGGTYVLDHGSPAHLYEMTQTDTHPLDFAQDLNYGLAVWHGTEAAAPRLAWGTQPSEGGTTSLMVSAVDGGQAQTLLSEQANQDGPHQFVAEGWSADGKTVYFSREPVGIGGGFQYGGASSLFSINVATGKVKEIVPFKTEPGSAWLCLDAFMDDQHLLADHCDRKQITIRNVVTGDTSAVQPPAEIKEFDQIGSAHFSADGQRVAFALTQGIGPEIKMGWLAVSDSLSGSAKVILTAQAGEFFMVDGWLDAHTLLVETYSLQACSGLCLPKLAAVDINTGAASDMGQGIFRALAGSK